MDVLALPSRGHLWQGGAAMCAAFPSPAPPETLPQKSAARKAPSVLGMLLALLCACPAHRQEPPAVEPRRLEQRLLDALQPLHLTGTATSLLVMDASGRALAEHRASDLVTPASTQKLLTAAAVLSNLPHDLRFETTLVGGRADASGVVAGDVWLIGGGDPSFGSARGINGAPLDEPVPSNVLSTMAESLRAAGVREVHGSVVGDGRLLAPAGLLPGWSWDDVPYTYSAPPSGLTFLEGGVEAQIRRNGTSFTVALSPQTEQLRVSAQPAPDGLESFVLLPGALPGDVLALWPSTRTRSTWREWIAVPDPPRYAAEQLTLALAQAGITVRGAPRSASAQEVIPADVQLYARHQGPTLRELAGHALRESLNLHTETLLMQLGRLTAADPSTRGGLRVVDAFLTSLGRDPGTVRLVDGSGLSRMNLLSARALVDVLRHTLQRDPLFEELLPVTGGPGGTLQSRLVGTACQGRVRAKTGSLTGHRNLVGVVHTLRGRTLYFAVMLSGLVLPRQVADAAVDQLLLALVQE